MTWNARAVLAAAAGAWLTVATPSIKTTYAAEAPKAAADAAKTDPFPGLVALDRGAGEDTLKAVAKEISQAQPADYPAIEQKLLAVLGNAATTPFGAEAACRHLRTVGSAKCVPAVAKLLVDEKRSHIGRYVLAGIPDASVDAALRDAMGKTTGVTRVGIVNTLGDRRDKAAMPALLTLVAADEETGSAALRAIGQLGTREAADALKGAKVAEALAPALWDARVRCAQAMLDDGNAADAQAGFAALAADAGAPALVRSAGISGAVRAGGNKSLPPVLEALKSDDRSIRQAGAAAVAEMRDPALGAAFAAELPKLPPVARATLVNALVARGGRDGLMAAINALVADEDAAVRMAAVGALRRLGDASSVPALAESLKGNKDLAGEVKLTLRSLFGDGVGAAMVKQTEGSDVATRPLLIEVLGDRRDPEGLAVVTKYTADPDKAVRFAALKALGGLGGTAELTALLEKLNKTDDGAERDAIEQAIVAIGKRNADVEGRSAPVVVAMANANPTTQAHLISVLAALGGNKALDAVRGALGSPTPDVRKAALRMMGDWVDAAPMTELLELAKSGKTEGEKVVALRGHIRMIGLQNNRKTPANVALYTDALALATRAEERRQVLSGLGNINDVRALALAETCFGDAGVKKEAFSAAVKIAGNIGSRNAAEVRAAMEKVIAQADPNSDLPKRAKQAIDKASGK